MHLSISVNRFLKSIVGAGVAGKKGGDACVALRPFPPAPHGRRKRPLSTPHLSRPYDCDDLPQHTYL